MRTQNLCSIVITYSLHLSTYRESSAFTVKLHSIAISGDCRLMAKHAHIIVPTGVLAVGEDNPR